MNITLLNVVIATKPTKTGKTYQEADVAFKNNTFQGKVEGKKVLSFGAQAEAFKVLAVAQPGETYEVNVVKNEKGYNDWISMAKAGVAEQAAGAISAPRAAAAGAQRSSSFETPEERAQRQVSIVRQSSLGHAVATLSVGAKKLEPADVIKVAKQYEDFVHGRKSAGASGFEDLPDVPAEFVNAADEVN